MSASPAIVRKGWCPGARRPMATGDGLLVRLHPLAGRLTAGQARIIAEAARLHGNGHLDITARGNLQIRGVREETYPDLMTLLDQEGLTEPEGDGPNRLVMVSPLAGIHSSECVDILALAQVIEDESRFIAGLPAKLFITINEGSSLPLDSVGSDIHLAVRSKEIVAFALSAPDGLRWIGEASPNQTAGAVYAILSCYAAMRASGRTDARRLRDLRPDLVLELVAKAQLEPTVPPPPLQPAIRAGLLKLESVNAALLALPFGRCNAAQLEQATSWSEQFGIGEIRLSFTRGILLPSVDQNHLAELLNEAASSGFVTQTGDPRLSLHACPGMPDCTSALTNAPDDALVIAEAFGDLLSQGATLHVSACSKGCARPGKSDLTLIGRADGRYDIVHQGCARDMPSLHLSVEEIMKRLLPLTSLDNLRHALPESTQ